MDPLPDLSRSAPDPLTSASREAAPPASLFLFKLVGGRQYGLTGDPTGRNIPAAGQDRWVYVRQVEVLPGEVRADFDADDVTAAVAARGYALIGCPFHVD